LMDRKSLRSLLLTLFLGIVLALLSPSKAQALQLEGEPDVQEAWAAIVTDADGNVLWARNEYGEIAPASITKIMTAIVALDSGVPFDTLVDCFKTDAPDYSQLAGYEYGTVPFGELMDVMLVYSANDASILVATTVAGSEDAFVELMNRKAEELGLEHTHFANSHGLEEPGHYSCAADLAVLARYAYENYPYIRSTVCRHSVTVHVNGEEKTFESTDDLIRTYEGTLGMKTGSTESGKTFMGACERGGIRIYSVVLGCPTSEGRFGDTARMWDWVWTGYRDTCFAYAGDVYSLEPFAFRFGFKCPIVYDSDARVFIDRTGPDINFTRITDRHRTLVIPGDGFGMEWWEQDGRELARVNLRVGAPQPYMAINQLILPLFDSTPEAPAIDSSAFDPITIPIQESQEAGASEPGGPSTDGSSAQDGSESVYVINDAPAEPLTQEDPEGTDGQEG
ncbi:MAG: D-alanyl-D-alanine carboxypeptidase, partial [Atopobiaceae bacterium]|nr:D-alanyl-D-alanine carboxypeptidase [Atopobiaceae bacterium]